MPKAPIALRQSRKLLSASTAEVRSAVDLHPLSFGLPCNFHRVQSLTLPGLLHALPVTPVRASPVKGRLERTVVEVGWLGTAFGTDRA